MPPQTTDLDYGIVAIDTEYTRPQQDASHLIVEAGRAAFVDTGVNGSVPLLLAALADRDLDVGDVDFVFLTHVHLDHAGGAGLLMQHLPNARCVVHPRGAPHMADPAKLVAGTEAVYGRAETRRLYGDIRPIAASRIVTPGDGQRLSLAGRELEAFYTEGHARHHYCLGDPASSGIFTGDSFGVSYRELDTAAGAIVFPTSTPVQFDPHEAHRSVDRIMAREPRYAYLTHYSRVGDTGRLADEMHVGIDAYVALAVRHREAVNRGAALRDALFAWCLERLRAHGYAGGEAAARSLLDLDIGLNAQGLEVWLDRQERRPDDGSRAPH